MHDPCDLAHAIAEVANIGFYRQPLIDLAVNTALMELRARSNRPRESGHEQDVFKTVGGADSAGHATALGMDLERVIATLPPRAVLVLHNMEGWKHEEITSELGAGACAGTVPRTAGDIPWTALPCFVLGIAAPAFATTPIDETRPFDPCGKVEIENSKGHIQVRAWDRAEVRVTGSLGGGVEKLLAISSCRWSEGRK